MSETTPQQGEGDRQNSQENSITPEEALSRRYSSVVIISYSSSLYEHGSKKGEPHLSIFSALATVAAAQVYKSGSIDNILLCGDSTFGSDKKLTTDLMVEKLEQLEISRDVIRVVSANNLYSTAFQVEALAKDQRASEARGPYLLVDFKFHDKRIRKHARAYGLKADTISAEDILSYFFSHFNREKYQEVLNAMEERERSLLIKLLSGGKGRGIKLATRLRGGSVTDVRVIKDEKRKRKLELVNTSGKNHLKKVTSQF